MADAELFVAGFNVEFLNGDNSYVVNVFYRTKEGDILPTPDKFSFSTDAKLKKFINNKLLSTPIAEEEELAEDK